KHRNGDRRSTIRDNARRITTRATTDDSGGKITANGRQPSRTHRLKPSGLAGSSLLSGHTYRVTPAHAKHANEFTCDSTTNLMMGRFRRMRWDHLILRAHFGVRPGYHRRSRRAARYSTGI